MRYFLLLILFISFQVRAQDPQLTQFYATPVWLNPAFTGANSCMRASVASRIQWTEIPGAFNTQIFSFDHIIPEISSGLGMIITNDFAGSSRLSTTEFGFLYAYELQLTRKWMVRAGVQPTITNRKINFSKLTFYDQLARDASTSIEFEPEGSRTYFDFTWGLLAYSDNLWTGISWHHMNQPNQAILSGESIVPRKFSIHAGAKIKLTDRSSDDRKAGPAHSISPAINYRAQGKFDQVDVGLYYNYKPMVIGFWYRGIPALKQYEAGYPNNDALAILVGYTAGNFNIGYSYDMTISWLAPNAGGAHEISINYQFCDYKNYRKKHRTVIVPCPSF